MIRKLLLPLAVALTAAFFGIAGFISIAEQPARLALAEGPMLEQWKISFQVAIVLQGSLTIFAGAASVLAFWFVRDWRWLAGGLLMLACWPWTLAVIQPINTALLASAVGSPETRAMIEQWGAVHGMRTALSGAALILVLWAGARSSGYHISTAPRSS